MIKSRSGLVWFLVFLTTLYTIATAALPNPVVLLVVRSFQVVSSLVVVFRYKPALVKVWKGKFYGEEGELLTFAIVLGYAALGVNAFWLWIWRGALEPFWMMDAAINGYCVVVSAWAGLIYSAAPGTADGKFSSESKKMITVVILGTIVMSAIGLLMTPAFLQVEEYLRPYMAESLAKSDKNVRREGWPN